MIWPWKKETSFSKEFNKIKEAFAAAELGADNAWEIRTDAAKYGGGVDGDIVRQYDIAMHHVYLKLAATLEAMVTELKAEAKKKKEKADAYYRK
jgi:hypothetical protein